MILESLKGLAHRERLVEEPAFQSAPVRWIITLDAAGNFLTLDDTGYTQPSDSKRKPKVQYKLREIPRRSGRTSGDKAEFLVDKAEYILGIVPDGTVDGKKSDLRRSLFLKELTDASSVVHDSVLAAVIAFLQNDAERNQCIQVLQQRDFASNELFAFRVGEKMLDEVSALRAYWVSRVTAGSKGQETGQCLLCGQIKPLVDKHDSIKLPGAVTSGVALVSFNYDAFEKHGLARNQNAPICRDCMVAYVNALRRCLDSRYPHPDGGTFPQQSVRLSDDTVAIYWDEESSSVSQALWALNSEDPSAIKALFEAAWKGIKPAFPTSRFYCLVLTGAQGRASVRGMHSGMVSNVVENLRAYFVCLEASGYGEQPVPISVLIRSLAIRGKFDSLSPDLAADVFLSAVLSKPLPYSFLAATVGRIRAERAVSRPRAVLLLLYFQSRLDSTLRSKCMSLDIDSTDSAYRYGRLLAVLEQLQISYHWPNRINTRIVDRFYSAASTRPATAFPRLLSLAQSHLRIVRSATSFRKQIEEILAGLDGAKGFMPTLNLEQQGRFALGYFHQRAARFHQAEASAESKENAE